MERPEDRDYEAVSVDPDDFEEPLEGPEYVDPADMPDPANDLEGPDPEPTHLQQGSPYDDRPNPEDPSPNAP